MNNKAILLLTALLWSVATIAQTPKTLWENRWDTYFYFSIKTGFSSDSKYYAIGTSKGTVNLFESETGNLYHSYSVHDAHVFCSLFQPGGTLVASGDKDGNLRLYDYVTKTLKLSIAAHNQAITAMTWSKDGTLLITGSRDNSVKIWDPVSGHLMNEVTDITGNVIGVRISNDNKTLICATRAASKGLRVFDIASKKELRALPSANVQSIDISPDGNYIATANLEHKLTVWSLLQCTIAYKLPGHNKNIKDVAYSPNGKLLASSSEDNMVNIWNLDLRKKVASIEGRRDMTGLAWSPDNKYLAVMNEDGSLTMYDVLELFAIH